MFFRVTILLCLAALLSPAWAADGVLTSIVLTPGDQFHRMPGALDSACHDTIRYDNGQAAQLWTGTNFWVRVRFTPSSDFSLHSIYFYSTNGTGGTPNPAPCSLWVHQPNGDQLGALLSSWVMPGIVGDFAWNDTNLPVPLQFATGDTFYVVIGPVPGGPQTAGWHVIMDNANSGHSAQSITGHYGQYLVGPPNGAGGDLMIRAGGLATTFTDLEATECYNRVSNQPAFNALPGATVTLGALISNVGNANVASCTVGWVVNGPGGGQVYSHEVTSGPINVGATATVSSGTNFTATDVGEYMVTCTVTDTADHNAENNVTYLRFFAGGIDRWYRYDDNNASDSYLSFTEGNGWGLVFKPNTYPSRVDTIRVNMNAAGQADLRIYLNDQGTNMPVADPTWSSLANVDPGWNLIPVTPPVVIPNTRSFTIAYLFTGPALGKDDNPPNEAEITNMGTAISLTASANGASWAASTSGNWSVQAYIDSVVSNAADNPRAQLPDHFVLSQNYPNPFNPKTDISFALPQAAKVKLAVYNTLGQEVTILANETMTAGSHTVSFDASNLPAGVYLYRLEAGGASASYTAIRKMMLLK